MASQESSMDAPSGFDPLWQATAIDTAIPDSTKMNLADDENEDDKERAFYARFGMRSASSQRSGFLELDKHSRFEILKHALSLDPVDRWCRRFMDHQEGYYNRQTNFRHTFFLHKIMQEHLESGVRFPRVLAINKEIYEEAKAVIPHIELSLSHGIHHRLHISQLINEDWLRKLHSITISDNGLAGQFLSINMLIVTQVIEQMVVVLRRGHSITSFHLSLGRRYTPTLAVTDAGLVTRMQRSLLELRNINRVTIDADFVGGLTKEQLTNGMKSVSRGLLSLPYQVRRNIYTLAANHNNDIEAFKRYVTTRPFSTHPPERTTPTILLLNRQIYEEALDAIRAVPFVFSDVGLGDIRPFSVEEHLVRHVTLRGLHHIELEFTTQSNLHFLEDMTRDLGFRSGIYHPAGLKTFKLRYYNPGHRRKEILEEGCFPSSATYDHFIRLDRIRDLQGVTITGTLPRCFTRPLAANMTIKVRYNYKLGAIDKKGGIVFHTGKSHHYDRSTFHLADDDLSETDPDEHDEEQDSRSESSRGSLNRWEDDYESYDGDDGGYRQNREDDHYGNDEGDEESERIRQSNIQRAERQRAADPEFQRQKAVEDAYRALTPEDFYYGK